MLASIVIAQKGRRFVGVDDLDMSFHDVAFEGLVLNQYGMFDCKTKNTMDDSDYVYLFVSYLTK
jgi:hypothetical protein